MLIVSKENFSEVHNVPCGFQMTFFLITEQLKMSQRWCPRDSEMFQKQMPCEFPKQLRQEIENK